MKESFPRRQLSGDKGQPSERQKQMRRTSGLQGLLSGEGRDEVEPGDRAEEAWPRRTVHRAAHYRRGAQNSRRRPLQCRVLIGAGGEVSEPGALVSREPRQTREVHREVGVA